MGVNRDGTVHLLHSSFFVPVGPYSTDRLLSAFVGELPAEGLPLVADILGEAFAVWGAVRAALRDDHQVHVEGVPPPLWQSMPCERAGKLQEDGRDLAFQGLTFVPPDGASGFLGRGANIYEASRLLFPLLAS